MTRFFLIAAMLTLPAVPAVAADPVATGHGALAGRSPSKAYRTADTAPACGKVMHSLPAGKLPTYGLHAHSGAPCAAPAIAVSSNEAANGQAQGD